MITRYITIESLLEKINRTSIPGGYWNLDEIKEWIYDALRKMDDKQALVKAEMDLEVVDGKTKIPAEVEHIYQLIDKENESRLQEILYDRKLTDSTYIVNGGYIYVNFPERLLTLQFHTMPVDDEGMPLIPDNQYYISGIQSFILFQIGTRAYWQGKILERQLQMLEQEWLFYVKAAPSSTKMDIMNDAKRFRRIHNKYFR